MLHYLAIGARCLIWSVFVVSFLGKVSPNAFMAFAASVGNMRVLPAGLTYWAAVFVVASEGAVCVLLAMPVPLAVVTGFWLAVSLLAGFSAGIIRAVGSGVREPCRCFGNSTAPLGLRHISRNAVLIVAAVIGAVVSPQAVHIGGAALAVFCGLMLGGLVALLDEILELFQPVIQE